MKQSIAAMIIILGGCASGTLPWAQGPQFSEPECLESCDAHYDQCPQVFANFPERGAVECPAEHNSCLKTCEGRRAAASAAPAAAPRPRKVPAAGGTPATAPAVPKPAVSSKEARLRELKHLYDEGLVSDDVYRELQRSILSEP
jgi:hypothetical protein